MGYRDSQKKSYDSEYFTDAKDAVAFRKIVTRKMLCDENVQICSTFTEDGSVASYRYVNEKGQRFFVLAYDSYATAPYLVLPDYFVNYYRQKQLIDAVEWLGEKPLAAKSVKNPFLYITTAKAKDTDALSVGLFNAFCDEIHQCQIQLDKEYAEIRFVNCDGELNGNQVILKGEIPAYGFAAFEVR